MMLGGRVGLDVEVVGCHLRWQRGGGLYLEGERMMVKNERSRWWWWLWPWGELERRGQSDSGQIAVVIASKG